MTAASAAEETAMNKGEKAFLTAAAVLAVLGLGLWGVPGVRFSAQLAFGLAGLCLLWIALGRFAGKHNFFKVCKRLFLVGVCLVTAVLICFEAVILAHGEREYGTEPVDAVIVLGAGVNGKTPSAALRTRINAARRYMEAHPEVPVVLSGGQGDGEFITEAECMRRELTRVNDAWGKRLLLEERSTSTAENFAFSKKLLRSHGIDTDTAVIGVVTNDFHIFRAELIARRAELTTVGIPAELPWWWLTANYYLREAFALVKTLIFD